MGWADAEVEVKKTVKSISIAATIAINFLAGLFIFTPTFPEIPLCIFIP
jgi:hypothetical protein